MLQLRHLEEQELTIEALRRWLCRPGSSPAGTGSLARSGLPRHGRAHVRSHSLKLVCGFGLPAHDARAWSFPLLRGVPGLPGQQARLGEN